MENKKETLQKAKNIFEKLKTDPKSVLFSGKKNSYTIVEKTKKIMLQQGQFAAEADKPSRTKNKRWKQGTQKSRLCPEKRYL